MQPSSPSALRPAALLVLVLLAAACGGGDAADDVRPGDSVGAAAAPSPAPPATADRDDDGPMDSAAVANYRLSMDKVRGLQQAAVNLHELQQRRPELEQRFESENLDWAQVKARIDGEPEVRRAIESAGISTRDYVLGTMALIQATMAHEMAKAGMNTNVAGAVSEENRRFIAEHEAEIKQVMEAMPSGDDDDTEP